MSIYYTENELDVEYAPNFYSNEEANHIFVELQKCPFYTPTYKIGNQQVSPNRKVCGFGDNGVSYSYSNSKVEGLQWSPTLLRLKADVEKTTECSYNFALINLYPDGKSSIAAHKDDEKQLNPSTPIPTISFGAARTLVLTREKCEPTRILLEHGSLNIMRAPTNSIFKHAIPAEPKVTEPRISVTFRQIQVSDGPPAKKRKTDETWFSKHMGTHSTIHRKWPLGENVFAFVLQKDCSFYLHIREIDPASGEPTSHGVLMNMETFNVFLKKHFIGVNLRVKHRSLIVNNQLAILQVDRSCVLQQIFANGSRFTLKPVSIQLSNNQYEKLQKVVQDIEKYICETILNIVLPNKIALEKCKANLHSYNNDDSKSHFYAEICDSLSTIVLENFECYGCIVDHPSQREHDCLMYSLREKYNHVGNDGLRLLNIKNIVNAMTEKHCICSFTPESTQGTLDMHYECIDDHFKLAEK